MTISIADKSKFKMAMTLNGYSQTRLAKDVGVSVSYMNHIVNGRENPSSFVAKKIADVLGKEMTELFEIKEG